MEAVDENEKGLDIFPDMYGIFESNVSLEHEYRLFKAKNYKVFYYIEWETETVVIKRILYAGMDLENHYI